MLIRFSLLIIGISLLGLTPYLGKTPTKAIGLLPCNEDSLKRAISQNWQYKDSGYYKTNDKFIELLKTDYYSCLYLSDTTKIINDFGNGFEIIKCVKQDSMSYYMRYPLIAPFKDPPLKAGMRMEHLFIFLNFCFNKNSQLRRIYKERALVTGEE